MTENERKNWLLHAPSEILLHGPSKTYADAFHWFFPKTGIVTSYTVQPKDVHDHFGVFRGVDMIESLAQTGVLACTILLADKEQKPLTELREEFLMAFTELGSAHFHDFVKEGETLINMVTIQRYKFREITFSGCVYREASPQETKAYFDQLNELDFDPNQPPGSLKKIAEFKGYKGRGIRKTKIK